MLEKNSAELPLLLAFAFIFMLFIISACDLMALFIAIEGLTLTLYVLAAFDLKSQGSIEAGLKYFCLGSIASGLFAFGLSLIYGSLGTLNYIQINNLVDQYSLSFGVDYALTLGLFSILCAFFFKLSIPPFHI